MVTRIFVLLENIVELIRKIKEEGRITDYNQCALLFPSLSAAAEKEFENVFEDAGIPYYAPRANNILNTEEFLVVFGILAKIFKVEANPDGARGRTYLLLTCIHCIAWVKLNTKMLMILSQKVVYHSLQSISLKDWNFL